MSLPAWHEKPIAKQHNRTPFDCGDPQLNEFLKRQARQSRERGGTKTILAIDNFVPDNVLGFYSISPASIAYARAPAIVIRRLARHDVPVYRLGRIATDLRYQGQRLGGELLLTAGRRCLLVAAWYAGYGAMPLTG